MTTHDNPRVFDVTTQDFVERVLKRSAQVPVVVDFWAGWCAPCRMLGPVLEQAVSELGGRVLLAKVDTDREPELGHRYQIRGIPAVKAFRDGKLVDEFAGARDARFVRAFLERLAPSEETQQVERAAELLQKGQPREAEALLRPIAMGQGAEKDRARLLLARTLLVQGADRLAEVPALLDGIDARGPHAEAAEQLRQLVGFLCAAPEYGADTEARASAALAANPADADARYALAAALALRGDHRGAMEHLIELVSRNRRYRDDGARKAMVQLFDQLGPDHDLVQEYRRRLQVVL